MSSAATATAIHPSWFARAATWVVNEAKTIKNTILKVTSFTPKISAAVNEIAPTVEAISNLVEPGLGSFEAHLVDVWSVVAADVDAAGAAAGGNAINVSFDAALVAAIKGFLPAVKAKMSGQASATPAS